jgi:hypothetical protein
LLEVTLKLDAKVACGYNALLNVIIKFELYKDVLEANNDLGYKSLDEVTAKLEANNACGYKELEEVTLKFDAKVARFDVSTTKLLAYTAVLLPNIVVLFTVFKAFVVGALLVLVLFITFNNKLQ